MNQSKKVTEGALLTTIFIFLMLVTIFVPGLLMITIFVLPIPFILYSYKHDWQASLIMLGTAVLLSSLFATLISLPLAVLAGIGGIMIGTAMHHGLTAYETWARGTIGFVIGLLLVFVFTQLFLEVNLATQIDSILSESIELSKEMMREIGFTNIAEEDWLLVEKQLSLAKNLIPVGITILSIAFSFISQWLSYKLMNRLEKRKFAFPPFRTLRLPIAIVWIYFFALVFMFMDLDPNSMTYLVAHNVFSLTGLFMVLQGLSFLFFITHKKKWPKALPVFGVVLTLFFPFVFLYFMRILGIIDIGFGLRDRHLKK